MEAPDPNYVIQQAFSQDSGREYLLPHVFAAAQTIGPPNGAWLFTEIGAYIISLRQEIESLKQRHSHPTSGEPLAKRRKLTPSLEVEQNGTASAAPDVSVMAGASFSATEISFSIPQRKKYTLQLVPHGSDGTGAIRAANPATGDIEFSLAWKDIDQIICVPVPEKAQPQFNFVVVPNETGSSSATPLEAIIWSVPSTPPKNITLDLNRYPTTSEADTYETTTRQALDHELRFLNKAVVQPDDNEFASSLVQPHRKNEKAYHVKAHRGTKDGFLYFLGPGILFGFKKPLAFFPFHAIVSISYTSVLQRTFNLNIAASTAAGSEQVEEIEFSMLDQADFAGIDEYVRRHGLNDASLAEVRKAKRFNVNSAKSERGVATNGEDGAEREPEEEQEGELAKAERELQDEEDEEEEDYDPGSEGESEGSGTSDDGELYGGGGEFDETDGHEQHDASSP